MPTSAEGSLLVLAGLIVGFMFGHNISEEVLKIDAIAPRTDTSVITAPADAGPTVFDEEPCVGSTDVRVYRATNSLIQVLVLHKSYADTDRAILCKAAFKQAYRDYYDVPCEGNEVCVNETTFFCDAWVSRIDAGTPPKR